ncbi:unnamed protein product [Adineta steineri]|uniref:Uncharacterized protein n=1 Tax=Adineta steineri TaxID=433720 RepID=A0A818TY32_9BILA|nr:unnamed protein product [Adineta steineri]CAF3690148.1 unnamed protein product [Adineta steineri]
MSSSNSHSHIEPSWKTYYDAKKLLRQTEQRLKDAREYYPHVHLNNNNHYENNDLSNLSSTSYLHHNDTSLIHAGNRSMLNDERTNNKHQLLDSEALLTIRRKISKQKIAAERRAEQLFHSQSDAGHMFETYRPHSTYSTSASLQNLHYSPHRQQRLSPPKPQPPVAYSSHLSQSQSFPSELDTVLQHSTSARILHRENDFERQSFHQPTTRKSIRTMPRENYSLSNGRTTQQRSASASNSGTTKYQDISSSHFLTANDGPRLKHVRRVESAHVSSSSAVKNSLITPDSWRTDPIITKKSSSTSQQEKSSKKKTSNEILIKRTKTDIEETLGQNNQRTEKIIKPKRDTSASKTSVLTTEKTPSKPKSDDDKRKLQDYIQQKRQHEEMFSNEKRLKDEQERIRRDKFKKFNEQIKETSHQHLPSSVTKRTSTFTPTTPKELTEQTRQRLLRVLGPATDYHINSPLEQPSFLERSSSSSSSSNESVIEVQPVRSNDHSNMRSRSEPPAQNGTTSKNAQRHENLLRWAVDLTRDCDVVENRFKYLRPDRILPFGTIPASYKHLQQDDGNIRNQTSHYDTNHSETNKSSNVSRLSRGLNSNRLNDYSNHQVSNDLSSDRRIHRDRAAAKIQAAYRGYTVRKSLPWLNDKPNHLDNEYNNKRSNHYLENASININIHLTKNNYPVDSTLLRYYENQPINDYQQQSIKKASILPLYSDDYDNVPNSLSSNLSTPINHIRRPPSTASSTSTTPIPSPEPQVPSQNERRRSISPPLPPQMSPDNGRPLHQLIQPIFQRINDENREQTDSMSRVQNLSNNTLPQQPIAKSPIRPPLLSSSTSTNQKRRSLSPQPPQQQLIPNTHPRHRTALTSSPPTSSSES